MTGACDWPIVLGNQGNGETIRVRCKSSDAAMCESCATLHKHDIRHLVLDGLAKSPMATFVTFTAPGTVGGPVHSLRKDGGRIRRCRCRRVHVEGDGVLGTPIDPETFDYGGVALWNSRARRLLTVALQKLGRLADRKLTWVAVPELQARGLIHFHVLILGYIDRDLLQLVVSGGRSPRETEARRLRPITPATHRGQRFGVQVDVQHITTEAQRGQIARYLAKYLAKACTGAGSAVAAPMAAHLHALSRAIRAQRLAEGRSCTHDGGHQRVPTALVARCAAWRFDRCHATRRALRQGGHGGRTFGRARSWPLTLADLRARRAKHAATEDNGVGGERVRWVYVGRGYDGVTTGVQRERLVAAALGDREAARLARSRFLTPGEITCAQGILAACS